MAQRLATQGANIVLHDKSWDAPQQYKEAQNLDEVVKRFEKFGIQTFAVTGNIGDVQAVEAMRDQIFEKFDGIDILDKDVKKVIYVKGKLVNYVL